MNIIGISAYYHDSACCLVRDGELVAGALEERFTGIKHDPSLPVNALAYCLAQAGMSIADVDAVAYYELPEDKLARQLWMGLPGFPRSSKAAIERMDPRRPAREITDVIGFDGPLLCFSHHLSHAASAFFYSGFSSAAILTADGVGEWTTTSYGFGEGSSVELREQVEFPHSLGLLYSTITGYLGFEVNEGEFKVMGLAPYGTPRHEELIRALVSSKPGGQFELDLEYFDFLRGSTMYSARLLELFGRPAREPESAITSFHADVACSLQRVLEEILLEKVRHLHEMTGCENLCLAGGVGLNCVANARIRREGPFKDMFVAPAANDAGGALGAAALAHVELTGARPRQGRLEHVFHGPAFTSASIQGLLDALGIPWRLCVDLDTLTTDVALRLSAGQVVGWFQGRMELGPRALGARSILADPRDPQMRDRVNVLVKKRESFRPFAPVVLEHHAREHFDLTHPSPFMVETCQVISRLELPAITHVDGSARVQTVDADSNPRLAGLLEAFYRLTGCPVLLNTSFNLRGEPIVCSPQDALASFVQGRLDALVLEDVIIDRNDLPTGYPEGVDEFYGLVALARRIKVSHDVYTLL